MTKSKKTFKLYRFSPIENEEELMLAINHIHFESYKLCKQSFGNYLSNAGNIGIFCHYDREYKLLINLRKKLTEESDDINQKYFKLFNPIVISRKNDIPTTTYTYLYIRRLDPYRFHVGDIDFYLEANKYNKLKEEMIQGKSLKGARLFNRPDLDMIELYNSDSDVLAYVSTSKMTESVRIKQSNITIL